MNQEQGRHGIQETGNPTWWGVKGEPRKTATARGGQFQIGRGKVNMIEHLRV